jgi:anaerobic C4-dicarboxylate transporter
MQGKTIAEMRGELEKASRNAQACGGKMPEKLQELKKELQELEKELEKQKREAQQIFRLSAVGVVACGIAALIEVHKGNIENAILWGGMAIPGTILSIGTRVELALLRRA